MLNDMARFRGCSTGGRASASESVAASRWRNEVFEPTVAAVPERLWGRLPAGRGVPPGARAPLVPVRGGEEGRRHRGGRSRVRRDGAPEQSRGADRARRPRRRPRFVIRAACGWLVTLPTPSFDDETWPPKTGARSEKTGRCELTVDGLSHFRQPSFDARDLGGARAGHRQTCSWMLVGLGHVDLVCRDLPAVARVLPGRVRAARAGGAVPRRR